MNEVSKFFRYVLPGLIFMIQLLVGIGISEGWETIAKLFKDNLFKDNLSIFLSVFLVSGALGYLFSLIYHASYWFRYLEVIDHRAIFKELDKDNIIEIIKPDGTIKDAQSLNNKDAWSILTRYWFSNYEEYKCIKELEDKFIESFANVVHGNGTTVIASFISIITWGILHSKLSGDIFFTEYVSLLIVGWFILIIFEICAYRNALKFFQSIINSTMLELIMSKYLKSGKVKIWFSI